MKKVLVFVAFATALFTSCQKERSVTSTPKNETPTVDLSAMKDVFAKSSDVLVIDENTEGFKCIKPVVTCSPVPVGVGGAIAHTTDSVIKIGNIYYGYVDAAISYKFYWAGNVHKEKMTLEMTYYLNNDPAQKVESKPRKFTVSSTLDSTQYGVFTAKKIKLPVNTLITFTIHGYNKCGQMSTLTFLYSYGYGNTAKVASENQRALSIINNAATVGTETNE